MVKYTRNLAEIKSFKAIQVGFTDTIYSSQYRVFDFHLRTNPEEIRTEVHVGGQLDIGSFSLMGREAVLKGCITYTDQHPFIGHCQGNVEIGTYDSAPY